MAEIDLSMDNAELFFSLALPCPLFSSSLPVGTLGVETSLIYVAVGMGEGWGRKGGGTFQRHGLLPLRLFILLAAVTINSMVAADRGQHKIHTNAK